MARLPSVSSVDVHFQRGGWLKNLPLYSRHSVRCVTFKEMQSRCQFLLMPQFRFWFSFRGDLVPTPPPHKNTLYCVDVGTAPPRPVEVGPVQTASLRQAGRCTSRAVPASGSAPLSTTEGGQDCGVTLHVKRTVCLVKLSDTNKLKICT